MAESDANSSDGGERIAKRIARAGLGSRRDVERWVDDGRVSINGVVRTDLGARVVTGDKVTVDGRPLPEAEPTRLWRYHKPRGLVTSARDEQGRDTVFDALPARLGRVISVGRLDMSSEGLLLLTNDGALARHLELPTTALVRAYRVRAFGWVDREALARLEWGTAVDGVAYGPVEVDVLRSEGPNSWFEVRIREGKNREVRRVLESVGLTVNRLIRTGYGPFELGELAQGAVAEVPASAVAALTTGRATP
jgi:23S rRNA pseudouridine2605 synthase